MGQSSSALPVTLGFLTVLEQPAVGHIGGFLVLNSLARPLEFHCTAPVLPSKAQQVLYGKTLKPYLYGEQIVHALVEKARSKPTQFFTDLPVIMEARAANNLPLALVATNPSNAAESKTIRLDTAHSPNEVLAPHFNRFKLGEFQMATHASFPSDEQAVKELIAKTCAGVDLLEPFERIREAIHEAQRPGK